MSFSLGAMRDAFEHFHRPFLWPYFLFGTFLVFSGLILFAIPIFIKRDKNGQKSDEISSDMKVFSHVDQNLSSHS